MCGEEKKEGGTPERVYNTHQPASESVRRLFLLPGGRGDLDRGWNRPRRVGRRCPSALLLDPAGPGRAGMASGRIEASFACCASASKSTAVLLKPIICICCFGSQKGNFSECNSSEHLLGSTPTPSLSLGCLRGEGLTEGLFRVVADATQVLC